MCMGGGSASSMAADRQADLASQQASDDTARRNARDTAIATGMGQIDKRLAGYDDKFYDTRSKAYLGMQMPELDRQYGEAQKQLAFSLARSNLADSSIADEKRSLFAQDYNTKKLQVADQAMGYANSARKDVGDLRSQLVNQLNATGDPNAVDTIAGQRVANINVAPPVSPLGAMFQNLTSGLAQFGGSAGLLGTQTATAAGQPAGVNIYNPTASPNQRVVG